MSILDKSSLVMIPSGYKEDKLYSVKPRNGDGDFTFTRASTGTRVNADGYIEEVPWNLNTNSEDFTSAPYTRYAGATATFHPTILSPSGNLDSTLISMPNSNQAVFINSASSVPNGYTKSIYARTVSGTGKMNLLRLYNSDGYAQDNGLYDLTEEWQRFDITNDGTATNDGYFLVADRRGSGVNLTEVLVWGAQINKGSLKPYIKTTDRLDIPRLDYSGGASCPTLLLEPQRTNLITYSEDYSSGNWNTSNTTITPNSIIAPSGLNVGSLITANGTNPRLTYNVGVGTGSFVFSWFAKKGTSSYLKVRVYDGSTNHDAVFDLENGTITSGNGIIEPYINGWFRCSLIYTSNGYTHFTQTWISNTSSGNLYLWGSQLEQGNYPTSYIPTSGTSVTRNEDFSEDAGDATIFNDSEGVLFVEVAALADAINNRTISLSDGTNNNTISLRYTSTSNQLQAFIYNGGVVQFNTSVTLSDVTSYNKIAIKYKDNDCSLYVNGTEEATDTSATMPSGLSQLSFTRPDGVNRFHGKCKQAMVFNEALTNEELETLTTI